ncbi:MAG: ATP-binding protein [Myxococcota bacterium]
MVSRLLEPALRASKKSVLLWGPRQVGKSTLLESLRPDLTINLALESEYFRFSSRPELLESVIRDRKPQMVFIDEIQRIPGLLNTAQALIDEHRKKGPPLRFLLSGSSARKLRRGQANLLPGRVHTYSLSGLCARELEYRVDLEKALRFGFLPEPYLEEDESTAAKTLTSYAATYLKEEIQAESLARNIQGFARFLDKVATESGRVLDFSKLAAKAKLSRSSCVRFVEILEDTLVAQRLPVFEGARSADTIRHPKLYFFDLGVWNGLLQNFTASADRLGNLFEHFVYQQLRNSLLAHDLPFELSYFRTRHGLEVDFVLRCRGKVWAIEAKAGEVSEVDLTGLRQFRGYYPEVHACIAVSSRENRYRTRDDIFVCNWAELLHELSL